MGAHVAPTVRAERDRIYTQLLGSGLTRPSDIAEAARRRPEFAGVRYEAIYCDVRMFLKRTEHLPVRIEERPTATAVVDFDSFVDGVTLRLPLGVMREVRRLVDTLRPEWRKLQGQATRVAELESRLRAAEAHRCEDPDEALREENTRLRGIIEQQSRRLEAFERLNHHRPITEEHLVVSSRD